MADPLSYHWRIYPETGQFSASDLFTGSPSDPQVGLKAPETSRPLRISILLEVMDLGSPRLTGYARAEITVRPQE